MDGTKLTVGARGSRLSLVQADLVVQLLKVAHPGLKVAVEVIRTRGDILSEWPLDELGGEGVFEEEVTGAVVAGEVDFAVHSLKDIPIEQSSETVIAAVPPRGSPHDVLVTRDGWTVMELPEGAVVGTGSPRRGAQLLYVRPGLTVKPIRGNVDTRLRKLEEGLYDALILSEAGLQRLGVNVKTVRLPLEDFTPAPGQGALAVVARGDRVETVKILEEIDHPPSRSEAACERALLACIGGGCRTPLGAVARADGGRLSLLASLFPRWGGKIMIREWGEGGEAEEVGRRVARELMVKAGGAGWV